MAIFTHCCLGANDVAQSRKFYDAALGALGINNLGPMGANAFLYGVGSPEFLVTKPRDGSPATGANGGTLEEAQEIANHASPKTTMLYDRSRDQITLDAVERIVI